MKNETFEMFALAAAEHAAERTGRPGINVQAVTMSMLSMLHARVVALEVAAHDAKAHARHDAPGREEPAAD